MNEEEETIYFTTRESFDKIREQLDYNIKTELVIIRSKLEELGMRHNQLTTEYKNAIEPLNNRIEEMRDKEWNLRQKRAIINGNYRIDADNDDDH